MMEIPRMNVRFPSEEACWAKIAELNETPKIYVSYYCTQWPLVKK